VQKEQLLIDLLRCEIAAIAPGQDVTCALDDKMLQDILNLAAEHSVMPLVADVLFKNKLLENKECEENYRQGLWAALLQYQQQTAELKKVCKIFEENKICHVALKGSVLRDYYPEPWLRTCCDVDILVKSEELEKARNTLENKGYIYQGKSPHDISFFSENNVHLELHFDMIEDEYKKFRNNDLNMTVWENSSVKEGCQYEYEMNNEMFYLYHIAHMVKHFIRGGCGIRPFVDIFVFKNNVSLDRKKLDSLLDKNKILAFANAAEEYVDVCFKNGKRTELIDDMQSYIFRGGVYGNVENHIAINQAKSGGKFKGALSKIFQDYDTIKCQYPILKKHKFLLPYFEVCRWCRLIFSKKERKRAMDQLNINSSLSGDLKKIAENLIDNLDL